MFIVVRAFITRYSLFTAGIGSLGVLSLGRALCVVCRSLCSSGITTPLSVVASIKFSIDVVIKVK